MLVYSDARLLESVSDEVASTLDSRMLGILSLSFLTRSQSALFCWGSSFDNRGLDFNRRLMNNATPEGTRMKLALL